MGGEEISTKTVALLVDTHRWPGGRSGEYFLGVRVRVQGTFCWNGGVV